MSHALILQHDPAFGPGRVVPVFRDYGIPTKLVRLDAGESLPDALDDARVLVLLGGNERLTGDEAGKFDDEVALVRGRVEADRPTLAFGLGAELLAKAAGAAVTPNLKDGDPVAHLGFGPVTLPFPGGTDPMVFGMSDGTPMWFWQRDAFELPKLPPPPGFDPEKKGPPPPSGNALIVSTVWAKNSGFKFKESLYGFAFHPEFARQDIDALLRAHGGAVGAAHGSGGLEKVRAGVDQHFDRYRRLGDKLLANFVQFSHAYEEYGR